MRLSLGDTAVSCVDPVSGDLLVCPPGTQCDPAGSNTCIGAQAAGTAECPIDVNLTGYTPCACPSGYELDAVQNQCVVPGVSVVPVVTDATAGLANTSDTTNSTAWLLVIGIGVLFLMGRGH
jgi:hypothetical protein